MLTGWDALETLGAEPDSSLPSYWQQHRSTPRERFEAELKSGNFPHTADTQLRTLVDDIVPFNKLTDHPLINLFVCSAANCTGHNYTAWHKCPDCPCKGQEPLVFTEYCPYEELLREHCVLLTRDPDCPNIPEHVAEYIECDGWGIDEIRRQCASPSPIPEMHYLMASSEEQ